MGLMRKVFGQIGSLAGERAKGVELEREFAFHVDMETEAHIAAGLAPDEARRRALLSFGGNDRFQEEMRDGWVRRVAADLVADVRFALRGLRRTPVFTATAIATLAVGLGGAAAVFTAIDTVLLSRLPYANEEQIVRIFQQNSQTNRWSLSVADYNGIQSWQRSFSSFVVIRTGEIALSGGTQPEFLRGGRATEGLFETFGISVARGRGFQATDAAADAPPVVVISDEFARRYFNGADPVGRTLVLDRTSHTVIGVLPAELATIGGLRADVWPLFRPETPTRRGPFGLMAFARLRPGVTIEAATADLGRVSDQLFPIYQAGFSDRSAKLTPFPLREIMFGDASKSLAVLMGAVVLVLLIALANVTNLVLVRSSGRRREIALRVALGAGRSRLTRLLLTESIVLSLLGGVLAVGVAAVALRILHAIGPALPRMEGASLSGATVLFTLLLAIASGVVMALYPMAFSTARGVASALRGGDRRASSGRGTRAFQDSLVVAEFTLALPLLAGAALLLHSFMQLQRVDVGVDTSNVVTMRLTLPTTQYAEPLQRDQFWADLMREVRALPGVVEAGVASSLPPDNFGDTNNFNLIDHPVPAGSAEPVSPWSSVSPGFFATLGVSLLEGRTFDQRDDGNAPPVLVVSRAWADKYFPGQSPVGRQLVGGGCYECPRSTVIGVVNDIKYSGLSGNGEGVYTPVTQWPRPTMQIVVRSSGDPTALVPAIRARIHTIDPSLPVADVELLEQRLTDAMSQPRHWTLLVGGFAGIAVLLAALGVFGVMSYIVSQQQREIGVRLALGAAPGSVIRLIVGRGLKLAVFGTVLGVVGAVQGTRLLEHVLFDTNAADPRTLATVAASLLGIATVACYLPGRRAAAVDPVRVISAE